MVFVFIKSAPEASELNKVLNNGPILPWKRS